MPTEQTPLEYYHYYRASQKRVQQWVKKTSRELEAGIGGGDGPGLTAGGSEDVGSGSKAPQPRGSRRRSSSSSKRDQIDSSGSRGPSSRSRSTRKKSKTDDTRDYARSRKSYPSDGLEISSLLPFGLFPLIFALTPPSVATVFSAAILLAGYFCVDYSKQGSISEKL